MFVKNCEKIQLLNHFLALYFFFRELSCTLCLHEKVR